MVLENSQHEHVQLGGKGMCGVSLLFSPCDPSSDFALFAFLLTACVGYLLRGV
uniref:Uncharacterized protein n=1 Tax=Lotus japonicus TaxID=34305 RepID=I3S8D4_LOTJA|nr:unknown [Lotus japonicus]